jgi:hypothetical protein
MDNGVISKKTELSVILLVSSSLLYSVQTHSGPIYLPNQWISGALSSRVKWPGSEADHLPPSSDEVHSPSHLLDEMLIKLSTTTTLPFLSEDK